MNAYRGAESCEILGVEVTSLTYDQLHEFILDSVRSSGCTPIYNLNAHASNIAAGDNDFREILTRAQLVFADGQGIVFAARLVGCKIPYRITFADWLPRLAAFSAAHGLSWYLLGGEPGVAEQAASRLKADNGDLRIVGWHDGFFDIATESEAIVRDINAKQPHILVVAMGMPRQEKWMDRYSCVLNAKILLAGGACLDYLSGRVRRCPSWMGSVGLEWLYRLYQEPKRLARRYLLGNPWFVFRFIRSQIAGPWTHLSRGSHE